MIEYCHYYPGVQVVSAISGRFFRLRLRLYRCCSTQKTFFSLSLGLGTLLLLGLVFFSPFPIHPAEARDIYVRLADTPKVALSSGGTMTLTDSAGKKHSLKKSITLTRSGASAAAGKSRYSLPLRISSGSLLGYNGRKYRGTFLLTRSFVLINILNVEDYVRGVLPAEAGSGRPQEYLKVQAIISRTYGLRQSLTRASRGYDVTDTTSDQVYKGAGTETPSTNQAVKETEGKVLVHGSALAFAPFHSDSGGHTAASAHVWTEDIPYLRGVKEAVAYQSPNASWIARLTAQQVQAALKKVGRDVGQVRSIRVAEADSAGRAVKLAFTGSKGSATVKSSSFRTAVGPNVLKSTMLTDTSGPAAPPAVPDKTASPAPAPAPAEDRPLSKAPVPTSNTPLSERENTLLIQMIADGVFSRTELMDMLKNMDKKRGYLHVGRQRGAKVRTPVKTPASKTPLPAAAGRMRSGQEIPAENGAFVFRGRGWGHGVGLSQWGAMAMAGQGWTAERILAHYYPGATVKRFQ
jgi:stage II sporulation protein D